MHGLVNRSIECFLNDTYGASTWAEVAEAAGLGFDGFEAMLTYDDAVTHAVLDAAAARLGRPRDSILEDIGTYIVSHPNLEAVRRLLRFGGVSFVDFLHSLDDLQGRGRLAVPDLDLPQLELHGQAGGRYTLHCRSHNRGFGQVMVGVLRVMADDYGALAVLEHQGESGGVETISIILLEQRFAEGRRFDLSARVD